MHTKQFEEYLRKLGARKSECEKHIKELHHKIDHSGSYEETSLYSDMEMVWRIKLDTIEFAIREFNTIILQAK